jgi:hypothetical protein
MMRAKSMYMNVRWKAWPLLRIRCSGDAPKTSTRSAYAADLHRHGDVVTDNFCVAGTESSIVCDRMTTQQKTGAIQDILKNHEDNVAAMRAAKIGPGLDALVIEAMNSAMKDNLAAIFAFKQVTSTRRTG